MNVPDRLHVPLTWALIVGVGFAGLCLPLHRQPDWILALGATLLVGCGVIAWAACRARTRANVSADASLEGARELPVVLVVGPYAAAAFPNGAQEAKLRREGGAVWLLVRTPDALAQTMAEVKASLGRFPDAALLPLLPDGNPDDAVMRREFTQWRRALEDASGQRACVLPCYLAIYACLGADGDDPVWFGDVIDIAAGTPGIDNARQRVQMIRRQLERAPLVSESTERAARNALGRSVLDWMDDAALLSALAALLDTAPFELHGVLLADIGYTPTRAGAWARWLVGKTGLQPPAATPVAEPLPLPDVVAMRVAPPGAQRRAARTDVMVHAVAAVAAVLVVSMAVSGWMNDRMTQRVASDLRAYWDTQDEQFDAKRDMLESLRHDYAELQDYARNGVPVALGWGFYRGDALQSALASAIASYHPAPVVLTLDSLSLFDSGKSTLNDHASQALQQALELIRENPDKRVLIAGHTDNVGNSAANLALSEARARAIRDWFVANASIPVTRFAIQGYGDTRPLESNDSADGRAKNRRVEITLLTDTPAH
jgi:outer membrane protein OmpA-like peptidoglycan-associated protein